MDYEPYHSLRRFIPIDKPIDFYTDTLQWVNPDKIFQCIVSLKKKYANDFIKNGIIKFNTPNNWEKYGIENTTGRGDVLEGSYAAYIDDNWTRFLLQNKYPDSKFIGVIYENYNLIHVKHKESMQLPCYCFYILKFKDFKISKTSDGYEMNAVIPSRYFRGLEDGRSWLAENELDPSERLVSVMINDYTEFIKRIKNALCKLGVSEKEIIIRQVKYEELDKPYDQKRQHPMELFVKDKEFSDQSEGRIVVHCKNKSIQEYLLQNTLEIGSIDDIAYLDEHYYSGGLFISSACK